MTAQQHNNFAARNKNVTIMNTKYTIKNFRVFDEKGVTVDIKPITILTGCNNSGKSSIVKSMVLFDTYLRGLKNDYKSFNKINLREHKLDFNQEATQSLGNFNQVLNRDAENKELSFEYVVHSILFGEDVRVTMTFFAEEKDILNEGYIKELCISKLDGGIIYLSSREVPFEADGNLIVDNFYRFIRGQYLVDQFRKYEAKYWTKYQDLTEDEYKASMKELAQNASEQWFKQEEKEVNDLKELKEKIDKLELGFVGQYGKDALVDVIKWSNCFGHDYISLLDGSKAQEDIITIIDKYANIEVVNQSYMRKTFFYCPLMNTIGNLAPNEFKSGLLKQLAGYKLGNEIYLAIDKIEVDFVKSGCASFEDYFKKKEHEFLKKSISERVHRYITSPCLWSDFTSPLCEDEPVGGYLNHLYNCIIGGSHNKIDSINFSHLCDFLMNVNAIREKSNSSAYYEIKDLRKDLGPYKKYEHYLYRMFCDYLSASLREIVLSSIPSDIAYVPTSLISIKRLYALEAKDDFTNLLKLYLEEKRNYSGGKIYGKHYFTPGMFINKWIKEFKIGDSVSIDADPEGLGVYLRLRKTPNDKKGSLLAEQGYGITQLFVILLRIEIAIMKAKSEVVNKDPYDMGTPSLHLYMEESSDAIVNLYESTIAIEEPEVHLHPNFQSKLADMFIDAYSNYNVHFVIETHSEYLIRKLQTKIARKAVLNSDISILYVYDNQNRPDSEPQVKRIEISDKGMLLGRFGEGFYDEADELSMTLLMQQRKND